MRPARLHHADPGTGEMMDGAQQVVPVLTAEEGRRLVASGVATGGMQAKLESAMAALAAGVDQVRIAPGAAPNVLERLLEGQDVGTRMVLSEVSVR